WWCRGAAWTRAHSNTGRAPPPKPNTWTARPCSRSWTTSPAEGARRARLAGIARGAYDRGIAPSIRITGENMAIDLNTLSAKELETLISKAKKRKTVLQKRKPMGTVRARLKEPAA